MKIEQFENYIKNQENFINKRFLEIGSKISSLPKLNIMCYDLCYSEITLEMELYNVRKKLLEMYKSFLYITKKKKLKNIDNNIFESHPGYKELKRKENEILCKLYPYLK